MIKYNLKCQNEHEFESWFSDSNEFDYLKKKNLLECVFCPSKKISKLDENSAAFILQGALDYLKRKITWSTSTKGL